jgi:hypothetical protein
MGLPLHGMWNFLRGWWNVAIPVVIAVRGRPTFANLEFGSGGGMAGARDFLPIRGSVADLVGDNCNGSSWTPQLGPVSNTLGGFDLPVLRNILAQLVDKRVLMSKYRDFSTFYTPALFPILKMSLLLLLCFPCPSACNWIKSCRVRRRFSLSPPISTGPVDVVGVCVCVGKKRRVGCLPIPTLLVPAHST